MPIPFLHPLRGAWPLWAAKACWGMFWGAWAVVLPDIQARFDFSDAELGRLVVYLILGVLPTIYLARRISPRLGRFQLGAPLLLYALATLCLALAPGAKTFTAAAVATGIASGLLDVTVTYLLGAIQRRDKLKAFSFAHAIFPMAVFVATPLFGLLRSLDGGVETVFGLLSPLFLAVGLWSVPWLRRVPELQTVADAPGGGPAVARGALVAGGIVFVYHVFEHAVETWSVLFLERELGAAPWLAALGASAYMGAAAFGRLLTFAKGHRIDDRQLIVGGLIAAAAAFGLLSTTGSVAVALAAIALAGLVTGPGVPAGFSLASTSAPAANRAGFMSTVALCANFGFLASPAAYGAISDGFGMRTAWLAFAATAVVALAYSLAVRRKLAAGTELGETV